MINSKIISLILNLPDESISMAGLSACPTSVTVVTVKETSVKLKLMAINPLSLFVYTCNKIQTSKMIN